MPEVTDAVTVGGAYKEDDDFVPNPTDAFGTLDTSATAGAAHGAVEAVTPIFEVAKAQEAIVAAKALDPEDDSVPASMVILPDSDRSFEDAKKAVEAAAKAAEENPVEVGGLNPFQRQAAETTGEEGQEQAQEQQQSQAESAGSASTSTDTARQKGAKGGNTEPVKSA